MFHINPKSQIYLNLYNKICRYKIYVEGVSWSVSKKYILACDSSALLIHSKYHDFFSRGLIPMQHYYPVKEDFTCDSINSTVSFGNSHQQEVISRTNQN